MLCNKSNDTNYIYKEFLLLDLRFLTAVGMECDAMWSGRN
jgi:hypothetical protein